MALRASGREIVDLTGSNPTSVGLFDDAAEDAELARALDQSGIARYQPDPRGLLAARHAVSRIFPVETAPERVFLTASTSEAYSLIFKLLCDPGDIVLVPRPSYPLFDHLTALDAVRAVSYPLRYAGAWEIDLAALGQIADEAVNLPSVTAGPGRVRALLVVNPNNPTGNALDAGELGALVEFCAEREIALIGDEVFFDYLWTPRGRDLRSVGSVEDCLAFSLGGLSKLGGLPQLKLGWISVSGPNDLVASATARLEIIADAYLSANMPVQLAVAPLLDIAARRRGSIAARVEANRRVLSEVLMGAPAVSLLAADGGWSAVLRVPEVADDEEGLVVAILEREGVLVHPGYFFDFPHGAHLVVSLLLPPAIFRDGLTRVLAVVGDLAGGLLGSQV